MGNENLFGTLLRAARRTLGLSQRALAAQVDADFTYLSKIETGKVVPSAELTEKLARALGYEPEHFWLAAGNMPLEHALKRLAMAQVACRILPLAEDAAQLNGIKPPPGATWSVGWWLTEEVPCERCKACPGDLCELGFSVERMLCPESVPSPLPRFISVLKLEQRDFDAARAVLPKIVAPPITENGR